MPLYDFRCAEGHQFERHVPLVEFDQLQHCSCSAPAQRLISRPMFMVESVGYNCPITDKWIGSKTAHKDNLARHGCRVLESGEKEASMKFRAEADAKFEAALDETVERSIEAMPSAKKEKLYNELTANDLAVTRA